jgi:carboxymethylenebutenolidase
MSFYRGMTCENVTIKGDKGTPITAYVARPSGHGPFPGVVLVHHLPGWSEFYIEGWRQRRQPGRRRRQGARRGRHCRLPDGRRYRSRRELDTRAARSQWQGWSHRLLLRRAARLHLRLPTEGRRCLRRTMGWPRGDGQGGAQREDARRTDRHDEGPQLPAARSVRQRRPRTESGAGEPARGRAQEARQDVRVPPLRWRRRVGSRITAISRSAPTCAGHGFFYWHRPLYRPDQAMDGWSKIFAFFGKYLAK